MSEQPTPSEIAQHIRERLQSIAPFPWKMVPGRTTVRWGDPMFARIQSQGGIGENGCGYLPAVGSVNTSILKPNGEQVRDNTTAHFIADAPQMVAWLLERVQDLESVLEGIAYSSEDAGSESLARDAIAGRFSWDESEYQRVSTAFLNHEENSDVVPMRA